MPSAPLGSSCILVSSRCVPWTPWDSGLPSSPCRLTGGSYPARRRPNMGASASQLGQLLVAADEGGQGVAGGPQAVQDGPQGPAVRAQAGVVQLVPGDRHRNGGARRRAGGEGGDEGLVDGVLGV